MVVGPGVKPTLVRSTASMIGGERRGLLTRLNPSNVLGLNLQPSGEG
jgi:hypothetical protein